MLFQSSFPRTSVHTKSRKGDLDFHSKETKIHSATRSTDWTGVRSGTRCRDLPLCLGQPLSRGDESICVRVTDSLPTAERQGSTYGLGKMVSPCCS